MSLRSCLCGIICASTMLTADPLYPPAPSIAQYSNQLGFDLVGSLDKPDDNTIYSPFAIFHSLSLISSGAEGKTRSDLERCLHWPDNRYAIAQQMRQLSSRIFTDNHEQRDKVKLTNASIIFTAMDVQPFLAFEDTMTLNYNGRIQRVDFDSAHESASEINKAVGAVSDNKLYKLVTASDIRPGITRMLITSGIFFRDRWEHPFNPQATRFYDFNIDDDNIVSVEMMHQVQTFPYFENEKERVVILPFEKGANGVHPVLVLALPTNAYNFNDWYRQLNNLTVYQWSQQSKPRLLSLNIPKIHLRVRYDLEEALTNLGMGRAFGQGANFTSFTPHTPLSLDKVVHEAYLDINEAGAEDVTLPSSNSTSTIDNAPSALFAQFAADRPFAFFLIDTQSGAILFQGKYVHPAD